MTVQIEKALIDIDLKEVELVFEQSHIRMNLISNYIMISVALGGAVVTCLATLASISSGPIPITWFLVIPFPFFMFGFLILREDLLMANHQRYLYQLRKRILEKLKLLETDAALRFLNELQSEKIGGWRTLLSALRYGPPIFVAIPSFVWFAINNTWSLSGFGLIKAALVFLNATLLLLLFIGVYHLGKIHAGN